MSSPSMAPPPTKKEKKKEDKEALPASTWTRGQELKSRHWLTGSACSCCPVPCARSLRLPPLFHLLSSTLMPVPKQKLRGAWVRLAAPYTHLYRGAEEGHPPFHPTPTRQAGVLDCGALGSGLSPGKAVLRGANRQIRGFQPPRPCWGRGWASRPGSWGEGPGSSLHPTPQVSAAPLAPHSDLPLSHLGGASPRWDPDGVNVPHTTAQDLSDQARLLLWPPWPQWGCLMLRQGEAPVD